MNIYIVVAILRIEELRNLRFYHIGMMATAHIGLYVTSFVVHLQDISAMYEYEYYEVKENATTVFDVLYPGRRRRKYWNNKSLKILESFLTSSVSLCSSGQKLMPQLNNS